jgi:hypothetical protein
VVIGVLRDCCWHAADLGLELVYADKQLGCGVKLVFAYGGAQGLLVSLPHLGVVWLISVVWLIRAGGDHRVIIECASRQEPLRSMACVA